ncbi:MAG: flagellar biosynthesis repressor FlbT, partial [Xanthobacteraceae bacterium]
RAAPSAMPHIASINNLILTGQLYKALKETKKLISYEQDLLQHAIRGEHLPHGGKADRQST